MIPYGWIYCKDCASVAEKERAAARKEKEEYRQRKYNRTYNSKRDPKYATFYRSKEWRILSRAKLQDCGYKCEAELDGCKHIACEVHHKKAIKTAEGWEHRLDWENLFGVCTSCHNKLDKRFNKYKNSDAIDLREVERRLGGGPNSADHFGDNEHRGSLCRKNSPRDSKF